MINTENRNPNTMHLDQMSALEIVSVMNQENANSVSSLEPCYARIAEGIEAIAAAFSQGGRMISIGAGTSGRLAVLDASECPPTFGVSCDQVIGICAGGMSALVRSSENKEDDPQEGIQELKDRQLCGNDVVIGISASGGAAYVCKALDYANSLGCTTICISSNANSPLAQIAHIAICPDTGPEVLTGSKSRQCPKDGPEYAVHRRHGAQRLCIRKPDDQSETHKHQASWPCDPYSERDHRL